MVWFLLLLIQVGFQVLSGLLAPKPNVKRETEPQLPEIDQSTPIPVPFGECLIKGAMLLDYLDFKSEPIKIRNPSTFFITTLTIGYRYFLGLVFGIGWGKTPQGTEGAVLLEILIDNRVVFTGGAFGNEATPVQIDKPSFFGSEKQEGGIRAHIYYYVGEDLGGGGGQNVNAYWQAQRGLTMPNYKDLAYCVWHGPSSAFTIGGKKVGYIGNSARLWPIAFKVRRQTLPISNGVVGRPGDTPASTGNHANPIDCLWECLTSTLFGAGIPSSQLYLGGAGIENSFLAAAYGCWSEGLGFSYLWTSASPVEEMVAEILRYIDGTLWTDVQTGQIRLRLVRADYTPGDLIELSNDDFLEIESFTRGSWADTRGEVRVTFPDHSKVDFEEGTAFWQDLANVQIQGVQDAAEISYRGCPSQALANRLAARDGRVLATPLAKLTAKADRKIFDFHPGKVFKFSWPEQGISQMILRVANMKLGTVLDGAITINAVEDVFAAGVGTYGTPTSTIWTDPLGGEALDSPFGAAAEIPYWVQRDDVPRVFGISSRPDSTHISYDGAIDGEVDVLNAEFTPTGTLQGTYPQVSLGDFDTSNTLIVGSLVDKANIAAGTTTTIPTEGAGLAIIGDPSTSANEWIAFESVTDNGSTLTLNNVWRGVLDTPPLQHAPSTRIWFYAAGNALFVKALGASQAIIFEALTRTMRDQLTSAEATNRNYTTQRRAFRPLPPYYVTLGGSFTNEQQNTGDVVLAWRDHSRLAGVTATQIIKQSATDETAEAGVTWELDLYKTDGVTLLRSVTGLSSTTYTYLNTDELADSGEASLQTRLTAKIYAKRDGLRSLYPWIRFVFREVDPGSFGNGDFILPAQVFDFVYAADTVAGFDALAVDVFS